MKHTILIGNPGVGKSTLGNGLLGSLKFVSGMGSGGGLTTVLQNEKLNDNEFISDTPGLADLENIDRAAKEIEAGLKQGGQYRLVFVVKDDDRRVRAQDVETMRRVLEAIDKSVPFSIVINKIEEDVYDNLMADKQACRNYLAVMQAKLPRPTALFHLIPRQSSLAGKQNCVAGAPIIPKLWTFLESVSFTDLPPSTVKPIDVKDYEEAYILLEAENKALAKDNARMERQMDSMLDQLGNQTRGSPLEDLVTGIVNVAAATIGAPVCSVPYPIAGTSLPPQPQFESLY